MRSLWGGGAQGGERLWRRARRRHGRHELGLQVWWRAMFGQGRGVRGGRAVQPCGGRQPAEAMLASNCARYVCDTHICPLTTLLCLISSFLPQLFLVPAAIHSTSSRPSSAAAWVAAAAWAALGERLPACWHACMHGLLTRVAAKRTAGSNACNKHSAPDTASRSPSCSGMGGGGARSRTRPVPGDDQRYDLRLDFTEAVFGCK